MPSISAADVDRARLQVLAAGEGEQALDQGRRRGWRPGARRRSGGAAVGFGRQSPAQQVEVADHRGQQIVEVVRDAAGELAERFELLRFVELGQRALALAGALLDPRFERLVGGLQMFLARLQLFQPGARLVLPPPRRAAPSAPG